MGSHSSAHTRVFSMFRFDARVRCILSTFLDKVLRTLAPWHVEFSRRSLSVQIKVLICKSNTSGALVFALVFFDTFRSTFIEKTQPIRTVGVEVSRVRR